MEPRSAPVYSGASSLVGGDGALTSDATPFDLEEDGRYTRDALLGTGGMGRVYAATDRRLGRQVALKELHDGQDTPAAIARLVREAWVTARLDHPGIVPVHDAGRTRDGALYYTMRLVRGRNLATALAEAAAPEDRVALVRVVLDASRAVAFAHDRRVVHRDLKPANLLLGAFGETQVADWGLARPLDEPDLDGAAVPLVSGDPSGATLTRVGAVIGTPGYMAPEQARGEAATPATDVWALGAVLHEVLTGTRPADAVPGVEVAADQPELWAIIRRATAADPADRYPDAGALAEDLDAWFAGRRVSAHTYTPWELLRRLVTAWRVPLEIGAVALVAVLTVAGLAWQETARERDRARAAEDIAEAARADADQHLALALRGQAAERAADGVWPEAAMLAARSAAIAPTPEAFGVWMDAAAASAPRLIDARGAACDHPVPAPGGDGAVCRDRDEVVRLGSDGAVRWRHPGATDGGFAGPGRVLVVERDGTLVELDDADGAPRARREADAGAMVLSHHGAPLPVAAGGIALWIGMADLELRPCPGAAPRAASARPGASHVDVVCSDGAVVRVDALDARPADAQPLLGRRDISTLAWIGDDTLIGTFRGRVVRVGPDGAPRWDVDPGTSRIAGLHVATTPDGEALVAVAGDGGRVALLDGATGATLARLPGRPGQPAVTGLTATRDAATLTLVHGGIQAWSIDLRPPVRTVIDTGHTWVGDAPGGAWWVAVGNGGVWTLDPPWGRPRVVARTPEILKVAAPSPDGRFVLTGVVRSGPQRLVPADGGPPLVFTAAHALRRAGWFDATRGYAATSGPTLIGVHVDGRTVEVRRSTGAPADVVRTPAGLRVLTLDGEVFDLPVTLPADGGLPVFGDAVPRPPAPGAIALAHHGDTGLVVHRHAVHVEQPGRAWTLPTDDELVRAAVSPDGRRVALGTTTGAVLVHDLATGALLARAQRHGERVSWLAWTERELVSVGWDGHVVRGDPSVLDRDPADEAAGWEARLGLGIDDVLRGG